MGTGHEQAVGARGRDELRFLQSIVESANDAILVTEAEPVEEPGPKIVYVNETFTRMTGYTLEDVKGKTPRILQGPDTDPAPRKKIREALNRWKPVRVELLNYRKDGTRFWVELNIVPVADETGWYTHWVSVQRETTERRREEEEKREREERFRASLARNASDVAMILEEDGTVSYASPSAEKVFGYGPDELVGESVFGYLHGEDGRRLAGELSRMAENPGAVAKPIEYRFRRADGGYLYVEAVGNNLLSDPGVRGLVFNLWDVTERRRVEEELLLKDRAIASSSNGIVITDATLPENPVTYVNRHFEQMTGHSQHEILGRNCRFLAGDDRNQPAQEELRIAIHKGREWSGILRNYRKNGELFWNELSLSPVRDKEGRLANYVGILKDITDRKRLEEELHHRAFHDPLTDLPNRALFMDRLDRALARCARRGEGLAVLFMDLDDFKVINDSLGHEVGDDLLVDVAGRLAGCVRPQDTVARLGGDEFVVLLEDLGEAEEAPRAAHRIADAVRQPFRVGGRELVATMSVGIAFGGDQKESPGDLLRNADLAMYRAKDAGKNGHAVFEAGMDERALKRLGLEADLRRALEGGEFRVHYQPKVGLSGNAEKVVGFEALVRWEHPERGLVYPGEFISVAEETGLIIPLGRWVLEEACEQAKEWREHCSANPALKISVNLSSRQLREPGLSADVERVLAATGLDPEALILEITESMVIEGVGAAMTTLQELKALGVKIAVDDFGTGYSSLSYLKHFPVDYLKIDRSFVSGLGHDPKDEGLVSAVIELARALDLHTIAEGVETGGQLERLRSLGCEWAQGFYLWKPMPPGPASALLSSAGAPAAAG